MLLTAPTPSPSDADVPLGASGRAGADDDRNPKTIPMPSSGDATPTEQLAPLPITMPMPTHVPPRPGGVPTEPVAVFARGGEPVGGLDASGADAGAPVREPDDAGADAGESAGGPDEAVADVEASPEESDASDDSGADADASAVEPDEPDAQVAASAVEPDEPHAQQAAASTESDDSGVDGEAAPEAPRVSTLDAPTQAISPIGPATTMPAQKSPVTTRPKQLAWSNLPDFEPIPLGAVAGGFDVTGTHPTLPPVSSYTAAIAARTAATGVVGAAGATAATSVVGAPATAPVDTQAAGPDAGPTADAAPAPAVVKKRRRRRALIVTASTVALVLVLAGIAGAIGWQVAETHASSVLKQTVQQKVDKALGLPASHPVAVTFDEPVLPQLRAGTLDRLRFTVAGAPIVGSTGTITMKATGVPTEGSGPAKSVEATVRLKPDALAALVNANRTTLGQILPGTVKVDGSDVTVSLNPAQFLSGVSFSEVLHASVKDGGLVLTPTKFVVGGLPMSADTVRARFGGLAQGILATRTICLADTYPRGMTLTGLEVKKDAVVADFDVQPGILTDPALQAAGTCK